VPPPGVGVNTVTVAVPAEATSAAGTVALSCVAETYVVVRLVPFHLTTEDEMKLFPVTANVNEELPTAADEGLIDKVTGRGLLLEVIVNVNPDEVPPPGVGLNTVTVAVPPDAISAAGTVAVNLAAETYVVVRLVPFHLTTDDEIKLLPFTVNVNEDPPAAAEDGLNEVATGTGLLTE
jgi:hypothetical protein